MAKRLSGLGFPLAAGRGWRVSFRPVASLRPASSGFVGLGPFGLRAAAAVAPLWRPSFASRLRAFARWPACLLVGLVLLVSWPAELAAGWLAVRLVPSPLCCLRVWGLWPLLPPGRWAAWFNFGLVLLAAPGGERPLSSRARIGPPPSLLARFSAFSPALFDSPAAAGLRRGASPDPDSRFPIPDSGLHPVDAGARFLLRRPSDFHAKREIRSRPLRELTSRSRSRAYMLVARTRSSGDTLAGVFGKSNSDFPLWFHPFAHATGTRPRVVGRFAAERRRAGARRHHSEPGRKRFAVRFAHSIETSRRFGRTPSRSTLRAQTCSAGAPFRRLRRGLLHPAARVRPRSLRS